MMCVSPSGETIVYLPEQANTGGECTIQFRKVACVRPVYIRGRQLVALPGHTKLSRDPTATIYPNSPVNMFKALATAHND
jgi:hypothetical protein